MRYEPNVITRLKRNASARWRPAEAMHIELGWPSVHFIICTEPALGKEQAPAFPKEVRHWLENGLTKPNRECGRISRTCRHYLCEGKAALDRSTYTRIHGIYTPLGL